MTASVIKIDKKSNIPLYGVDFLGIIDRGTNIIELKPITTCNLKCKYCFVSSGDYENNFIVDSNYLVEKVKELVEIKGKSSIEIHIAPYGEILLYNDVFELIQSLWNIKGIEIISMQSNGLLLTPEIIKKLEQVNLTRINLSLNTLSENLANYLCNVKNYNVNALLQNIKLLLKTNIDVLIAPVWFPGVNDKDIENIVELVVELRSKGNSDKKIQLGIQKYLMYKTGRKLKKIRPKTWKYFYTQLSRLEKKYYIKLKLGPNDFGIHRRDTMVTKRLKKGDILKIKIKSKGRWNNECIGKIDDNNGIKVLIRKPLTFSEEMIGKEIKVKIIKANYRDNIITAYFPL
jgi:uncharacterized Fe-S cluster-containing radical SAM superfamily enzyme